MVGMTGLEPATSRPPAVRATGLRHIPKKPKSPAVESGAELISPRYVQVGTRS